MRGHEYLIEFACCRIRVVSSNERVRCFLADYLAPDQNAAASFHVEAPESADLSRLGLPDDWPHRLRVLHERVALGLLRHDVLLCHASALVLDGRAYLFVGPSGAGKSTHAALWRGLWGGRVVMVCDDKPWLRVTPEAVFAHGSPWAGKHGLHANVSAPVAGLCFLDQSPENRMDPLTPAQAAPRFLAQVHYWTNPSEARAVLRLADAVLRRAPLWRLRCAPTFAAARLCREVLRGPAA